MWAQQQSKYKYYYDMSTFKLDGTIYVKGVKTPQEAQEALLAVLDEYEEMNQNGAAIVVHHEMPIETNAPID